MTLPPVFLIGFMAAGKSTLGNALCRKYPQLRFVDLDKAVEERAGTDIPAFFATRGEEAFRRLEAEVLRDVAAPATIIACGGGTPCHKGNMDFMSSQGITVLLEADDDTIIRRLRLAPGQRPLLDALLDKPDELRRKIEQMRSQRMPHYGRCAHRFDANRLETVEQIDESVNRFFAQILNSPQ